MTDLNSADGAHDFDFFIGDWQVRHRRLKLRLAGCTDWQDFAGSARCRALMGGLANVDDNELELPDGRYTAVSLRSFCAATQTWAIWWLDARQPHMLDRPVVGRFQDGVGVFETDDTLAGQPIRVRFTWSDIGAQRCRWQQAFSADAGATWETNWIMEFSRLPLVEPIGEQRTSLQRQGEHVAGLSIDASRGHAEQHLGEADQQA